MLRTLFIAAALAFIAVAASAAIAGSTASRPAQTSAASSVDQRTGADRFVVHVTPEMKRHSRIGHTLFFVGSAWSMLVLLFVLGSGWARRIRDAAMRITKRRFLAAMIAFVLLSLVTALLEAPLTYYGGYVVPHQFALTTQSFGAWLLDEVKGLAVSLVVYAPLAALVLLGIAKIRRWWLAVWIGAIPVMLLLVVLQPLLFEPLFNDFQPLKDQVLRAALLDEASRAGIEGGRVYQVDKSKQTTTMNAYVTGIGPSSRIVMWDTLLAKMSHDEVLAVMGHEMGHYVLKHIWKGMAFGLAIGFVALFAGQRVVEWGARRFGPRWGFATAADPAALPWLLLVFSIFGFVITPIAAAQSRYVEHQADQFGLELTHLNEPMATAFVKLAEDSKQDPDPSALIEWWFYSHPSINRRIAYVLHYKPWAEGKPNEVWSPK